MSGEQDGGCAVNSQQPNEWERPAAAFATCAAEPCNADADTELRATPADHVIWVPLCPEHRRQAVRGFEPLEYIVQLHGFIGSGVRS